jgi:hypothetical protein
MWEVSCSASPQENIGDGMIFMTLCRYWLSLVCPVLSLKGEGKEEEDENVDSAWIKYLKTVFDDTGYSVIWKIKIFQILIG